MKCPICKKELDPATGKCPYCGLYPNSKRPIKSASSTVKKTRETSTKPKKPVSAKMNTGSSSGSRQITRTPQLQSAIESLPKPLHQKLNREIEKIPEIKLSERFEIIEKLGRGGMGEVFKAREKGLDRIVAIKRLIIKEEMAYYGIMRFFREAQTLARLNHQNIVNIFQNARDEHGLYIVMEYIDGITLSKLIRIRGGLSREECIYFITSIAKALEFAHNLNIVHRDVKPGNVMLTGPGFANINTSKKLTEEQIKQALKETTVKVLDFGLAKLKTGHSIPVSAVFSKPKVNMKLPTNLNDTMTQEVELSVSGSLIGTMVYSSPEQKSNPKHVDKRADIYSLGLLFYQILVGEVPKEVQIEKVPTAFRNLIQKAIEPDIKLRISSATEFLELLNEVVEEEQKFKEAQKGSADDCRRFMHEYPNSIFLSEVKQSLEYKVLEEAEYRKAVAGTTKDCETYLETFKNGRYTQQITDLLIHKQASEAIIFEMIKMFIISFITGGLGGLVFTASTLGMLFGFILGFCIGIGIYWYRFRYKPKIRS